MKNTLSIEACDASCYGQFCKPLYDSYCFSRIPATIEKLLVGSAKDPLPSDAFSSSAHDDTSYDNVVLFFLDSFGWRQFEKYSEDYPFLKRFLTQGIVSKITSQFPSTTTPHVTTMHTGLSVSQSGLYEWFYYEPIVDAAICPLYFSYAHDSEHDTLLKAGYSAKELFPFTTFYQSLAKQGISSYVFQDKSTTHSPYSQVMLEDATVMGYKHLSDGLLQLTDAIRNAKGKNYFFFYFGNIDGAGHHYGPNSQEVQNEIELTLDGLETFWTSIIPFMKNSCCIVTADHGMQEIVPQNSWFLNKELPHFTNYMTRNKKNELIVPCGSSRDFFLYLREESLQQAYSELKSALNGIAEVKLTSELIEAGIFGPLPIGERLQNRLGNVVLLPYGSNSTWWYEPGRFENPFHGHHGGLTHQEMQTIFLFQQIT